MHINMDKSKNIKNLKKSKPKISILYYSIYIKLKLNYGIVSEVGGGKEVRSLIGICLECYQHSSFYYFGEH